MKMTIIRTIHHNRRHVGGPTAAPGSDGGLRVTFVCVQSQAHADSVVLLVRVVTGVGCPCRHRRGALDCSTLTWMFRLCGVDPAESPIAVELGSSVVDPAVVVLSISAAEEPSIRRT